MAKRKRNTTKQEIIQSAAHYFFTVGYSETSPKLICDEIGISTGNLTYYFPTKEHLLAEMVDLCCEFQWMTVKKETHEGYTALMSICLEVLAIASMCEESNIARDFYIAAYTQPLTLEIIRRNDAERAKEVFADFCPDWTDSDFAEAETLVSGIKYATMMTTGDSAPLEKRIVGALDTIMTIYNVPKETRELKIKKSLNLDYRNIGRSALNQFKQFVAEKTRDY